MADVFDVASYILKRRGPMTAMKLQKLVYYCQAWSLVWDEAPLFDERIEAWANGPVCPELYDVHRGWFTVSPSEFKRGDTTKLTKEQAETIDRVLDAYGKLSSQELSDLTHREDPWKEARRGLPATIRSNVEITHAAMAEYYEGLSGLEDAAAI
jgi:uncharacterized phage-associated protein